MVRRKELLLTGFETKAYKMHVRVLLSRYRGYSECPTCRGSRLKSASQCFGESALKNLPIRCWEGRVKPTRRFRPVGSSFSEEILQSLPGLNLQDIMLLLIERLKVFFDELRLSPELEKTCDQLLKEIRTRFSLFSRSRLRLLNFGSTKPYFVRR